MKTFSTYIKAPASARRTAPPRLRGSRKRSLLAGGVGRSRACKRSGLSATHGQPSARLVDHSSYPETDRTLARGTDDATRATSSADH